MIIDYSTARPTIAALKAAGVTAVGRYIGWDSVPGYQSIGKNLTKPEAQALIGSGLQIFLAFEYAADAATNGTAQGVADGALATTQLKVLGAPDSMAVYFAVDFDIPDYEPALADTPANALAKLGPVGRYFQAIKNMKQVYELGAYGGYYAIKRLFDAGLIARGWQTIAWSGGMLDSRAEIYQTPQPLPSGFANQGIDTDIREHMTTAPDFGQWPRPAAVKPAVASDIPAGSGNAFILNMTKGAYVLPIPAGKSKAVFYADPMGSLPPSLRIGFGPEWSKVEIKPNWDTPAVVAVPAGVQRMTVSRLDTSIIPVTLDFA
jgi:hypothetical protein